MTGASQIRYRLAEERDLETLVRIETKCFSTDRLSRRSFRHWVQVEHGILMVACENDHPVAYGLVWCHKGTCLARLYSLAVLPACRGGGIAETLLGKLEQSASDVGRIYLRLEVGKNNTSAIKLYEKMGYQIFGEYTDYYDDHTDALRMQKNIQQLTQETLRKAVPWYQQTTDFTCGPAALMMAMASQRKDIALSQELELDIWRTATTIFMTSGHGGTHPFGLALAASEKGFDVEVCINTHATPFLDSVRNADKKAVLDTVHQQFKKRVEENDQISVMYSDVTQGQVERWLQDDYAVMILISTFRLDGKKAPHWVTITHSDEHCFYVHDPDCVQQRAIDCQHVPIARADFEKMSSFGSGRLRTALALHKK